MRFLKDILFKILYGLIIGIVYLRCFLSRLRRHSVGLVLEEFFHQDFKRFGGYGMTAKNISDYYNSHPESDLEINVLISSKLAMATKPRVQQFHQAKILFRSADDESPNRDLLRYLWCFGQNPSHVLLTIEYYVSYDYIFKALPWVPIIIYIRDPRGPQEWSRLGAIAMELQWRKMNSIADLLKSQEWENNHIHDIIKSCQRTGRKIIFATNAEFLAERAKKAYCLPDMKPYLLPNPLVMPDLNKVQSSVKPSLIFMGRLDPQKRIWMVFELAKQFKHVDFIIAGAPTASYGGIMDPVIERYKHLDNLKFLGTVDGEPKWKALGESWGMINTSIHEGLPVTFLESLCMAKPIISCLNPDELVSRFGYYTGDILGEGMDRESLERFSRQIELFLADAKTRQEKGRLGREYVEKRHTFKNFDKHLKEIFSKEKIF